MSQSEKPARAIGTDEIESLFREHNRLLVQLLTSRLGSVQAAREVAQEAYVRLLKLDDTCLISHQRAYLFRIAQNLATDRLRKREKLRQSHELDVFDEVDVAADPARSVAADEEVRYLQQVLQELPPKCQRAFALHRFRGLSFAEIAEDMQLSERMIRIYVTRGLAYCQSRLDEWRNTEDE